MIGLVCVGKYIARAPQVSTWGQQDLKRTSFRPNAWTEVQSLKTTQIKQVLWCGAWKEYSSLASMMDKHLPKITMRPSIVDSSGQSTSDNTQPGKPLKYKKKIGTQRLDVLYTSTNNRIFITSKSYLVNRLSQYHVIGS